jgi:hypothetical protein
MPKGVYQRTPEHRRALRLGQLGASTDPEHRRQLSLSQKERDQLIRHTDFYRLPIAKRKRIKAEYKKYRDNYYKDHIEGNTPACFPEWYMNDYAEQN